jgi:methyl-accepting chemotaxis protein
MGERKFQHRRTWAGLLINPQFQMRYFLWITFVGTAIVVSYSVVIYEFFLREQMLGMQEGATPFFNPMDIMALIALCFILIMGVIVFVLSHRTAGALYHFKKVFNEINGGNHNQRIRLRKNDDFQDVAAAFNEMMDQLQKSGKL